MNIIKKVIGLLVVLSCFFAGNAGADSFIVKDGKAASEIVVAEKPFRMVQKAALELQKYIKQISGAELKIVNKPTSEELLKIYIGKSQYTDELGITDDGLKYGAFKMVSGEGYLVLLGYDFDFEPKEPWAHRISDRGRAQEEWDEISGSYNINTMNRNLYRAYHEGAGIWSHDGAGSFNAVCEYLRSLGVRWYMPGELGEVVPQMQTIPLNAIKKTVIADHPLRHWFGLYGAYSEDTLFWDLHLGMNSGYQLLGAGYHVHGMWLILSHEKMFEANPEYYALEGGKRNFNHACFSNEGLAKEAAHYARKVYDYYNEPCISLWPNDGIRKCECKECAKFSAGELLCSFVDKVARDLYTTHPDKWVSFGAYSSYRYPPENLGKFPPNVLLFLAAHRPELRSEEGLQKRMELVNGWLKSVGPKRLIRNSNNYYNLVMHPRSFAKELKALKDISLGEWSEQRRRTIILPDKTRHVAWLTPGIDHLNQYVNARYLWDADRDIKELFDEYYELYYGPAGPKMRLANNFAEAAYDIKGRSYLELRDKIRYFELVSDARAKAGDSVYGKRVQLILDELGSLEKMKAKLKEEIKASMRPNARLIVGKDVGAGEPEVYEMVDLVTGKEAEIKTTVKVQWQEGNLIFDIHCDEPDMENLFVTGDVWGGDSVGILLETDEHKYYQMEVNPDGKIVTADREFGKVNLRWDAQAKVETKKGKDYWSVRVTVPVLSVEEGGTDPLHNVIGSKPAQDSPWYFFVGRVRLREGGEGAKTHSGMTRMSFGLSKTGGGYHSLKDFAKLEIH